MKMAMEYFYLFRNQWISTIVLLPKKKKKIIYHIFKKDTGISVLFDFVFASNV